MKWVFIGFLLFLIGCSSATETAVLPTAIESTPIPTLPSKPEVPIPTSPPSNRRVEQEPIHVNPLIRRDGIAPIYNPQFATVENAPYEDEELVMGVAWGGKAKAYPVTVLRFREMVDDELAGIPTLVTW